jgi:hypothetical protein
MIDKTPYIIVDNHKIAPIRRASKMNPAPAERPNREDRPFGVVDRVTISRQAMEKYRQLQAQVDAEPSVCTYLSRKLRSATIPLLTDSSKKRC